MRVTYLLAVLCAGALQLPATLRSQEHTVVRPRVEEKARERAGGRVEKVDKADKWDKKRTTERTTKFNQAAKADAKARAAKVDRERKDKVDRERKDVRRRTVEKADKWDKNQITKKFNDAANPPPPPNNNGGGKSGGNPPPSGPSGPKGPKGPKGP
jgi:hypothetical protein